MFFFFFFLRDSRWKIKYLENEIREQKYYARSLNFGSPINSNQAPHRELVWPNYVLSQIIAPNKCPKGQRAQSRSSSAAQARKQFTYLSSSTLLPLMFIPNSLTNNGQPWSNKNPASLIMLFTMTFHHRLPDSYDFP
jgi:hypothetical protein